MKFISSISKEDCLFQDLKMILSSINHDDEYLFLPNPHPNIPFSFKEIVEIGQKYGANFVGFECKDKKEILKNKKFPLIVTLNSKEGKHAIIVRKFIRNKVKIIDPSSGASTIKIDDFLARFDGFGLYLNTYKRRKCPEKSIEVINKSDVILITIVECLSGVTGLLGTYFVSSSYPFYIPIIFFAFFFIFEILLRKYAVVVMEKMDKKYLYSDYKIKDYFSYYTNYNNLKTSSMLIVMKTTFAILVSIFICFILIMNSFYSLINIGIVIVSVIINYIIEQRYFMPKNKEISRLENEIKSIKNKDDFVSLTKKVNKEAYQYGLAMRFKKYITVGIYLFTSILVMAISSNAPINITYLLFNIVVMVMLDQYVNEALTYNTNLEKYLSFKNYINQHFKR